MLRFASKLLVEKVVKSLPARSNVKNFSSFTLNEYKIPCTNTEVLDIFYTRIMAACCEILPHYSPTFQRSFSGSSSRGILDYYLHWTPTFEV